PFLSRLQISFRASIRFDNFHLVGDNDPVNLTNNGITKDVQPQAVHPKPVASPISEPTITPVSASRPNPQASIPYPSRRTMKGIVKELRIKLRNSIKSLKI
nr:hypothetical protein [Tanacetum cinerariifolium]